MSIKVAFEMELSQLELRDILDNRIGGRSEIKKEIPQATIPEIESKGKGEGQKTTRKIREMAPRGGGEKKLPAKAQKAVPAYVANIGDLNAFLRPQLDNGLQTVDWTLQEAGSTETSAEWLAGWLTNGNEGVQASMKLLSKIRE